MYKICIKNKTTKHGTESAQNQSKHNANNSSFIFLKFDKIVY